MLRIWSFSCVIKSVVPSFALGIICVGELVLGFEARWELIRVFMVTVWLISMHKFYNSYLIILFLLLLITQNLICG